jgi:hypothetical protein
MTVYMFCLPFRSSKYVILRFGYIFGYKFLLYMYQRSCLNSQCCFFITIIFDLHLVLAIFHYPLYRSFLLSIFVMWHSCTILYVLLLNTHSVVVLLVVLSKQRNSSPIWHYHTTAHDTFIKASSVNGSIMPIVYCR